MEPAAQPWEKHLHPVNLCQQITKMVLVVPRLYQESVMCRSFARRVSGGVC